MIAADKTEVDAVCRMEVTPQSADPQILSLNRILR